MSDDDYLYEDANDTNQTATPEPAKKEPWPPIDNTPLPIGTSALLDGQLTEALKIMRDFSTWIHSPTAPIDGCMEVSRAVSSLMQSSATLAKVAARLQHGEPGSRHTRTVEHVTVPAALGGGGVSRKVENEK